MKEIVIISGKGGTGKTSVTAALACVSRSRIMADCDVDAADLHLILQPRILSREDFYGGVKAVIDPAACVNCGQCGVICRFGAISHPDGNYEVDPLDCEGCGYCQQICPAGAISLPQQKVGQCYISDTRLDCRLVHAKLDIGADNSGKLVVKVKRDARQTAEDGQLDWVLVDGSPGIGCPVISSLSGADFVILVTEPSLSGLHDLERVWSLTGNFGIPGGCVINKADLNPGVSALIGGFLARENITLIDHIPYDEDFTRAMTQGISLVEYDPQKWQPRFARIWSHITKELT